MSPNGISDHAECTNCSIVLYLINLNSLKASAKVLLFFEICKRKEIFLPLSAICITLCIIPFSFCFCSPLAFILIRISFLAPMGTIITHCGRHNRVSSPSCQPLKSFRLLRFAKIRSVYDISINALFSITCNIDIGGKSR